MQLREKDFPDSGRLAALCLLQCTYSHVRDANPNPNPTGVAFPRVFLDVMQLCKMFNKYEGVGDEVRTSSTFEKSPTYTWCRGPWRSFWIVRSGRSGQILCKYEGLGDEVRSSRRSLRALEALLYF